MISLQFLVTAFVVVLAPGTGVIYTLALGLGQGRAAAVWAALGCTFGIVPHLAAATLGLAAILHTSALAFNIVKYAGVAYLLWLAVQTICRAGQVSDVPNVTAAHAFRTGMIVNLTNPKVIL
ncbi:MAG: LysE family translocator, partial [Pseudomonadota bacterium]